MSHIFNFSMHILNFTFQSGYIQIEEEEDPQEEYETLHSNLVIFKSVSYNTIYSSHFKLHFLSTYIFTSAERLFGV